MSSSSLVNSTSNDLSIVGGTSAVNPQTLVSNIDIFIAAVIALVILLRLPRGLARFWKTYEWCNGHFLGYTRTRSRTASLSRRPSQSHPTRHPSSSRRNRSPGQEKGYAPTDESHTLYSHTAVRLNQKGQQIQPSYPPHISSYPSFIRPLVGLFRSSYVPGYSNLQLLIMLAYFGVLLFALLYQSNTFTDPSRAGWIAVSQLPFLFAFAAKNNVLGWLLGVEYQKVCVYQPFLFFKKSPEFDLHPVLLSPSISWTVDRRRCERARNRLSYVVDMLSMSGSCPLIMPVYKWSLNGNMSTNLAKQSNTWGLVCLISVDLILIFSTSFWRTKSYNIFLTTHFAGYVVLIPSVSCEY